MDLRNVAIIAHVDHGKTTLVDNLLKQAGAFRANQQVAERAMDRNDLERERGITILAKCTAVDWQGRQDQHRGHARPRRFRRRGRAHPVHGGRRHRAGATPPKARCRRPSSWSARRWPAASARSSSSTRWTAQDARPDEVLNEVFDLFAALGADDEQLDFPILYASGRQGWADDSMEGPKQDLSALFDLVLRHVPAPGKDATSPSP